jgi:hypothetical protein
MSTHEENIKAAEKIAAEFVNQKNVFHDAKLESARAVYSAQMAVDKSTKDFTNLIGFQYSIDTVAHDVQCDIDNEQKTIDAFTPEEKTRLEVLNAQIDTLQKEREPLAKKQKEALHSASKLPWAHKIIASINSPEGVALQQEIKQRKEASEIAVKQDAIMRIKYDEQVEATDPDVINFIEAEKKNEHLIWMVGVRAELDAYKGGREHALDYVADRSPEDVFQAKKKRAYDEYVSAAETLAKKAKQV